MSGLLRKLAIGLCKPIYKLIPDIYNMFFKFANGQFFTDSTISQISSNIYVIVSVVMLFAFSITILSAIVNPDLLTDNKKGVTAVFKRAIFGLVLMVLIPILFNEGYKIQKDVMEKGLIEKLVVGVSYNQESPGGNGGQVIAGTLIASVLYPVENGLEVQAIYDVQENYSRMVILDINYIDRVAEDVNVTTEGKDEGLWASKSTPYAFEFNGLVAIIAGGACCYILLLFSIDTAIRMVKLGFLELTAPISIVSYIAVGDDILKRWTKEVFKTYVDVFLRIVCIAFYILLISKMDGFMDSINGGLITKVVLLVGLLIFVKQIPEFVNSIFGTNIQMQGGVQGRLGQMAFVGEQAKKAWNGIKNVAGLGIAAAGIAATGPVGLGIAGAAGGLGYLGHRAWNKGLKTGATPLKETAGGRFIRTAGSATGAFLKSSNALSGISAAGKSITESDTGKQFIAEREMIRKAKEADKSDASIKYKDGAFEDAVKSRELIDEKINGDRRINKNLRAKTLAKMSVDTEKAKIDAIKEKRQNIVSTIDSMLSNPTIANNVQLKEALDKFKGAFFAGGLSAEEYVSRVRDFRSKGANASDSYNLVKNLDEIMNILEGDEKVGGKLKNKIIENGNIKIKGNVDDLSSALENKIKDVNGAYEKAKSTALPYAQEIMEEYVLKSDIDNTYLLKQISKPKEKEKNGGSSNYQSEAVFSYKGEALDDNATSTSTTATQQATNTAASSQSTQQTQQSQQNVNTSNQHSNSSADVDYAQSFDYEIPEDGVHSSGNFKLNQEQVKEQQREARREEVDDTIDRMDREGQRDLKTNFKFKDDNKE